MTSQPREVRPWRISTLLAAGLFGMLASLPAAAGPFTDPGYLPGSMVAWATEVVWATEVDELIRGPQDIANPGGATASDGSGANVLGPATGDPTNTVSLGDGGSITVYLESGIGNAPADDFAVYENGFFDLNGLFAELAYVEVSSNGVDFARFDADALNPFPVATFDTLDPTDYHGLAGRHEAGLGTGFDLEDLSADPLVLAGLLNLYNVQYVRIVDVVGDGSTQDGGGNPIYDPYATAFSAGGFDLEAVGVLFVPEPSVGFGLLLGALTIFAIGRFGSRSDTRRLRAVGLASLFAFFAIASPASALTVTFDDLGMGAESSLNGSTLSGGYLSGDVFFVNDYNALYDSFSGFAASTTTDATTPGFGNQFSNITGSGAGGSAGFGLAFGSGRVLLPSPQIVSGAEFTNTTYAGLSMLNGDPFAKQFGGPTGDDPDFLRLLIEGVDGQGASTGIVELMLADYRFSNNALDFILDQWVFQDLTSLGAVKELLFSFESSDISIFGEQEFINTPAYFAIDNLSTIPEPGTALLMGLGLAWLANGRRSTR